MLTAVLQDGRGTNHLVKIDVHGGALTALRPIPPYGGEQRMRVFRQYLTNGGGASDSNDMRVAGSVGSPVDFWVGSHADRDRYVCIMSFIIADQLADLNTFGTISSLTNGCEVMYDDEHGSVTIHESLKSNFDFVRLCLGNPAFATGNNAFRANNISGNSEGFLPFMDLRQSFGFQWGVMIAHGTDQRITLRVKDDTTGVDAFNVIAYGFERLPD